MSLRDYFPSSKWIGRALTGRKARWVYVIIASLLLVATTVVRVHAFILTRRMHAVIAGLSKLHIDETSEEEVLRTVPYLVRGVRDRVVDTNAEVGNVDRGIERHYFVTISNEVSWMWFESFAWRFSTVEFFADGPQKSWIFTLADLLGYRYVAFDAVVVLLDGKVSSIRYGIANYLVFPQSIGNIVSIRSVHTRWGPHQMGFEVSSIDDESPQFNVGGGDGHITVLYVHDASPVLESHLFQVNLRCFWSLFGCRQARQLAPLLWQDKNAIEAATLARLQSNDPCPDRILVGRAKYLPDISVVLLVSTGFKVESVNEEGRRVDETWTHYKQIEVLRGRPSMSWESVRSKATVPYPGDYLKTLTNMGLQWAQAGEKVLAFSNLTFDSCQVVPASPSALSAIRNTFPAPRRVEDRLEWGLQ